MKEHQFMVFWVQIFKNIIIGKRKEKGKKGKLYCLDKVDKYWRIPIKIFLPGETTDLPRPSLIWEGLSCFSSKGCDEPKYYRMLICKCNRQIIFIVCFSKLSDDFRKYEWLKSILKIHSCHDMNEWIFEFPSALEVLISC